MWGWFLLLSGSVCLLGVVHVTCRFGGGDLWDFRCFSRLVKLFVGDV